MSASVDWVVDLEASEDEAGALATRALGFLVHERIVLPTPQASWPRAGRLLPPGPKAHAWSVHVSPEMPGCGLEVVTERKVFHTGDNVVQALRCPQCAKRHLAMDLPWQDAVHDWHFGRSTDRLQCPACGAAEPISCWRFLEFDWAFGCLGFGFNNWAISMRLAEAIAAVLGHRCRTVHEHLQRGRLG